MVPPTPPVVAPPVVAPPVADPVLTVVISAPPVSTPPVEVEAQTITPPVVETTSTPESTPTPTVADNSVATSSPEAVNQFFSQEGGGNQDVVLPATAATDLAITGNDPATTLNSLSGDAWQTWAD